MNLHAYMLTRNEEIGFQFEGIVSDRLTLLNVEHNELPHLFREDFKRDISKGVDFPNLRVQDVTIDVEAKKWKRVFPCWLNKVIDRFENSVADFKIVAVANYLKAGWGKMHSRLWRHGILIMSLRTLTKFIRKLQKKGGLAPPSKEGVTNYSISNRISLSSNRFTKVVHSLIFHLHVALRVSLRIAHHSHLREQLHSTLHTTKTNDSTNVNTSNNWCPEHHSMKINILQKSLASRISNDNKSVARDTSTLSKRFAGEHSALGV